MDTDKMQFQDLNFDNFISVQPGNTVEVRGTWGCRLYAKGKKDVGFKLFLFPQNVTILTDAPEVETFGLPIEPEFLNRDDADDVMLKIMTTTSELKKLEATAKTKGIDLDCYIRRRTATDTPDQESRRQERQGQGQTSRQANEKRNPDIPRGTQQDIDDDTEDSDDDDSFHDLVRRELSPFEEDTIIATARSFETHAQSEQLGEEFEQHMREAQKRSLEDQRGGSIIAMNKDGEGSSFTGKLVKTLGSLTTTGPGLGNKSGTNDGHDDGSDQQGSQPQANRRNGRFIVSETPEFETTSQPSVAQSESGGSARPRSDSQDQNSREGTPGSSQPVPGKAAGGRYSQDHIQNTHIRFGGELQKSSTNNVLSKVQEISQKVVDTVPTIRTPGSSDSLLGTSCMVRIKALKMKRNFQRMKRAMNLIYPDQDQEAGLECFEGEASDEGDLDEAPEKDLSCETLQEDEEHVEDQVAGEVGEGGIAAKQLNVETSGLDQCFQKRKGEGGSNDEGFDDFLGKDGIGGSKKRQTEEAEEDYSGHKRFKQDQGVIPAKRVLKMSDSTITIPLKKSRVNYD
ncbi:hypothetical protein BGZ65_006508 [Modicella reniformis]|uniref:Uncharacterized protein n=1 Tax=Modicella reniformis TaxID=1440133 RepID=A0A9P6IW44_9FUNG|nr:hypothetical protein BGZ65_006508 [Modicella reniformis]